MVALLAALDGQFVAMLIPISGGGDNIPTCVGDTDTGADNDAVTHDVPRLFRDESCDHTIHDVVHRQEHYQHLVGLEIQLAWEQLSSKYTIVSSVRPQRSDLAAEVILPAVAIWNSNRVLVTRRCSRLRMSRKDA